MTAAAQPGGRPRRIAPWMVGGVLLALAALALGMRYGPATDAGRGAIVQALDGLDLGSAGRLHVEGLTGDPWRDPRLARLTLSDKQGVWLDAHGLAVEWRPGELLERRVRIASAKAQDLTLVHRPQTKGGAPGAGPPVSVRVDAVSARVLMTPEFAYRQGDYDLSGSFDLERSGAIRADLTAASRLHAGDHLKARIDLERDKTFAVIADAVEAQGGALAGTLGLAPDRAFTLTAKGGGSIRQGAVFVDTRTGQATPLQVRGRWNAAGGEATGVLDLTASKLLNHWRGVVGPSAKFDVTGRKAADGFYDFALTAAGSGAQVTARGEADVGVQKAGPKGITLDARVADANSLTPFPNMGAAHVAGLLIGDRQKWRFAGQAEVAQMADAGYQLAQVSGPVTVETAGRDLLITVAPRGQGGAGQGLLTALLGSSPAATAEITRFADGRILIRKATVQGVGLTATGAGTRGILGDLSFKGTGSFSNLAMASRAAKGVVDFSWSASQAGKAPWALGVDARGRGFQTGLAEADQLLGPAPRLTAQASWTPSGLAISAATLAGVAAEASGAGLLGGDGALALKLIWKAHGPLALGPVEIDGAAKGTGDLSGSLAAPRADILADFASIAAPGLPLKDAHLALTFQRAADGGDGHVALTAASQYGPAAAKSAFRFQDGGLDLSGLDMSGGGVTAHGAVALRDGAPSSADLAVAAGPGLLLAEGRAEGHVKIAEAAGGPRADIKLTVGEAILAGSGVRVKSLNLTGDGPLRQLPYQIVANGPSEAGAWRLNGGGELALVGGARSTATFAGSGRLHRADFHTLRPIEASWGKAGLDVHASIGAGGGHADMEITQHAGAANIKASLADIDMSLLDQDYVGKLSGDLAFSGHGERLTGGVDLRLSGAGGRDLRGAPPVNGEVKAQLEGDVMNVRFDLGNSAGLKAAGELALPTHASAEPFAFGFDSRRPLSGRFTINGEIKPLWDLVMTGSNSLSGQVNADLTLAGTLADPRAVGQVALDKGRLTDADSGFDLRNVILRATLADNAVDISNFTADDGLKGQISGQGRASLARDGASSFRAELKNFRLIDTDLARATASGELTVNRAADGKVKLTGTLGIDDALISPTPPVASGVTPMDVVEIHRPDELDDQPAAPAAAKEAPVALDVSIRAPGHVFVRGRGLNLELSLDSHVGGTLAAPMLTGDARVVRGDYNFAGQRFQFDDRGVVHLGSTAQTIRLDLTATRDNPTLTAVIRISGTADRPVIKLSSTPSLPQDEILSQVLFGASASQLSGIEAAQLASAVAGLSGGGGLDLIGGLRSLAHLDRLAVAQDAVTGTTISGGKYITDRLYVELIGGGREGQGAQLEWRVKKHFSLVGKLGSQGDSQVSIRWRRSY